MTHSRSWDMEIGRPSVEHVTLGLRPRVTCSTSGRHISHVPLTTVRHLLIVTIVTVNRPSFDNAQSHVTTFDQSAKQLVVDKTTNLDVGLTTVHHLYNVTQRCRL